MPWNVIYIKGVNSLEIKVIVYNFQDAMHVATFVLAISSRTEFMQIAMGVNEKVGWAWVEFASGSAQESSGRK